MNKRSKILELDDIGFIGIGRPITEEESRIASAHIQAYMAKHPAPKRKTAKREKTVAIGTILTMVRKLDQN